MIDQAEIEQLNTNLKRFWDIDGMYVARTGTLEHAPILRIEEQCALQKAEYAINFENGMYRVGVPWRRNGSELPNNYKMALKRLENTEKKLARSPAVASAYSETINQYIRKVVGLHEKNTSKWYLLYFQ